MEILAVAIQKGGSGKTTTAAAIAHGAAMLGTKVLAIDLDPQGNLSFTLGANTRGKGSYELLKGDIDTVQSITPQLDVIPASVGLSTETSGKGTARRLQQALYPLREVYDLIVIDTPPTAGELQYNALQAATGVIIPTQADIYNLQGVYPVIDTVKAIQRSNPDLTIKGLVITDYDNRSSITRQMKEQIIITATAQGVPYLGTIRHAAAVKEAAALQQSLFSYAPNSKPAIDYLSLLEALNISRK